MERYSLRKIPDLLNPVISDSFISLDWPASKQSKVLTITSRLATLGAVGIWKSKGFLGLDTDISNIFFLCFVSPRKTGKSFLEEKKKRKEIFTQIHIKYPEVNKKFFFVSPKSFFCFERMRLEAMEIIF